MYVYIYIYIFHCIPYPVGNVCVSSRIVPEWEQDYYVVRTWTARWLQKTFNQCFR